jgi:hypothetical protein
MKAYLFQRRGWLEKHLDIDSVRNVLNRVASGTDTEDLVVGVYVSRMAGNRGTAYARRWMNPSDFTTRRGRWSMTGSWGVPDDLPERFKLIRMRLGGPSAYPRTETDIYGWEWSYATFGDHLAALFAHELHHYRRFHLGAHPREGEQAANRWALERVSELGFRVRGEKKFRPSPRPRIRSGHDPYLSFRPLMKGDRLRVTFDPRKRYQGEPAVVIRPIRPQSVRIAIETPDGKTWRWPMNWLSIENRTQQPS